MRLGEWRGVVFFERINTGARSIEHWLEAFWTLIKVHVVKNFAFYMVGAVLFVSALVPRLFLARSLDLVTDEGVYIPVGRLDVMLLAHGNITSAHWLDNYEAPALPKLFIGIGSWWGSAVFGSPGILLGARLPAVLLSSVFVVACYALAQPIFGRVSACWGCLALALSPWLAYFAAIAYLDTYLLIFVTLAVLLSWHAARRPTLLFFVGVLLGLAIDSKYTALFALLPISLYLVVYYFRQHFVPRRQLLIAGACLLGTTYLADPAIWANPIVRFIRSVGFQLNHSATGHNA